MPGVVDPETMNVDNLPGIWSPVQWELSDEEHIEELENQSAASLLFNVDTTEAILRLLLDETAIQRAFGPPAGFQPELQGEWDPELVTFEFKHPIELVNIKREPDYLAVEYNFKDFGKWLFEIEPEEIHIRRI